MKMNGHIHKILANYVSDNPGTKANLARSWKAAKSSTFVEIDLVEPVERPDFWQPNGVAADDRAVVAEHADLGEDSSIMERGPRTARQFR
jgi:hypothetical protein